MWTLFLFAVMKLYWDSIWLKLWQTEISYSLQIQYLYIVKYSPTEYFEQIISWSPSILFMFSAHCKQSFRLLWNVWKLYGEHLISNLRQSLDWMQQTGNNSDFKLNQSVLLIPDILLSTTMHVCYSPRRQTV